jgi:hypothetical protein
MPFLSELGLKVGVPVRLSMSNFVKIEIGKLDCLNPLFIKASVARTLKGASGSYFHPAPEFVSHPSTKYVAS